VSYTAEKEAPGKSTVEKIYVFILASP